MTDFTKKQEEQLINFGAFGYSEKKIASIMGVPVDDIISLKKDKNSILSNLLQKGKDMADYVIDLKLFEMAKSGDIKALDKLELRKRFR